MNILILGGGGREHALAWAFAQNPKCDRLFAAPGNPGIAALATCRAIDILDADAVVAQAKADAIDFVVIGPEAPLVAGIADALRSAGILTFGPSRAAAALEGSKAFAKALCDATGAPTAAYAHFTDLAAARAHLETVGAPIVVKADGLAAGKGVTVAKDLPSAHAALDAIFAGAHGRAEVVLEEVLTGEEASFFVLSDGTSLLPIGSAQDHKRLRVGDTGPNTGGMGAYAPAPVMTESVQEAALTQIARPVLAEMARRGTSFEGVLFLGLMIEKGQPKLIEFNVRFGDPETQALMLRLGAQALDALLATAKGELEDTRLHWAADHAVAVVMAAPGYPEAPVTGQRLTGLDTAAQAPLTQVFHAGTAKTPDGIVAAGGRVLSIAARSDTLAAARDAAYRGVDRVGFPGAEVRRDIAHRAVLAEKPDDPAPETVRR